LLHKLGNLFAPSAVLETSIIERLKRRRLMQRILPLGPQLRRLMRPTLALLPVIVVLGLLAATLEGLGIALIMPLLSTMTGTPPATGRLAGLFQSLGMGSTGSSAWCSSPWPWSAWSCSRTWWWP
jgi:hypothetical protein